jgi:hypothetical protein
MGISFLETIVEIKGGAEQGEGNKSGYPWERLYTNGYKAGYNPTLLFAL